MFNYDILNCFFKRYILKSLFKKKFAYFPIASWLVFTFVISLIYWIYVVHLIHTHALK